MRALNFCILTMLFLTCAAASAQDQKAVMRANFGSLIQIISGAIYDDNQQVVAGAKAIADHASALGTFKLSINADKAEEFKANTASFQKSATELLSTVQKNKHVDPQLAGSIVSHCVHCHNTYRPRLHR